MMTIECMFVIPQQFELKIGSNLIDSENCTLNNKSIEQPKGLFVVFPMANEMKKGFLSKEKLQFILHELANFIKWLIEFEEIVI